MSKEAQGEGIGEKLREIMRARETEIEGERERERE